MSEMGKLVRVIAIIALLMSVTISTVKAQVTGEKWLKLCSVTASEAELSSCVSYARGVADMIQIMQQSSPNEAKVCIPYDRTANELTAQAYYLIARLSLEDRDKLATVLLWGAWAMVYPCR